MKMLMITLGSIFALVLAGLILLSVKSQSGAAAGLQNGALTVCPNSPNCVSSEPGTPAEKMIAPFPVEIWVSLPTIIEQAGGDITIMQENYIAAEFSTKLFRFVDDVEFRHAGDVVHVRSASRVGHRDFNANAKRLEMLRTVKTD